MKIIQAGRGIFTIYAKVHPHLLHHQESECFHYVDAIDCKLTDYYNLSEDPVLLERAITYSRITEQFDPDNDSIIVLSVPSYLV